MSNLRYRRAYRRNLPHIQPPGAILFLTFRLTGSLPGSLLNRWRQEKRWLNKLAQRNDPQIEQYRIQSWKRWFVKFEAVLDAGSCGPLWLSNELIADQVAESLHYRDGKVYRLDAFSIMPNHVHTVFKPLPLLLSVDLSDEDVPYHSIASIMLSLKGYTAYKANRLLGREGAFWEAESFDHYVRDEAEWERIIAYVLNNPVKAGYVKHWSEWKWNYRRRSK